MARYRKKRRVMRRRRRMGRRISRRRGSRIGNQIFRMSRFVSNKLVVIGSGASQTGAITFALNDVVNPGEVTSLFHRFRITGIKYRWTINVNPDNATTKTYPRLTWAHEYEESGPTSLSALSEYPRMKEMWFGDSRQTSRWHFFRPASLRVGYEGAAASYYSPTWRDWVDTESPAVPFYGIKWGVESLQTGISLGLQCRYYIAAKAVK